MQSATSAQVRDAIKQLPIQERAVAIALKRIFDQVKELTRKQQQDIDSNHLSFIQKFKVLEKKASDIVQGKRQLKEQDLNVPTKYFTAEQQKQKQAIMKQKNRIQHYWLNAFQNTQIGPDLSGQEKQILRAVTDLQTNITTNEIELVFVIEKNACVQTGTYHRRLVLDNGMPIRFEGEQPKWISSEIKIDGILMNYIFSNTTVQDQLSLVFTSLGNIVNEIVPYSLEYYLGAIDGEFEGEQDQQQGDQNEDQADDQ